MRLYPMGYPEMSKSSTLTRDEVRDVDRRAIAEFGVSSLVLMENAGRGATDVLLSLGVRGRVVVVCGKGNNGGDGMVVARHLAVRGIEFEVLLTAPPEQLSTDAAANHRVLRAFGIPVPVADLSVVRERVGQAEWVVDALFGTGLKGPIAAPLDEVVRAINMSGTKVLAIDIPSGLDADTGEPLGPTIRAAHTVTFVASKRAFENPVAAAWTGPIHVADIGIPHPLPREVTSSL